MSLQDEGFRFTFRDGVFNWRHPLDIMPGDVDMTDASDEDFEKFFEKSLDISVDN